LRAWGAAVRGLVRNVPFLFAPAPATPLRVLCIAALDTLHALRCSRPLPRRRREALAAFLDLQACANAAWDGKPSPPAGGQRQRVEEAGLSSWLAAYLDRAGEIEARRPAIGGDRRQFEEVRAYREAVARLALAAVAGIALGAGDLEESLRSTDADGDLAALFRLAMLCQVLDDVLDYEQDRAARLPSFLTACASLSEGVALIREAARAYGATRGTPAHDASLPLRLALRTLTTAAAAAIAVRGLGARRRLARRPGAPACRRAATR
jgi:hypothetical protein